VAPRKPPASAFDPPPVVPWAAWYAQKAGSLEQGQHQLFIGPTQSGKTLLCRKVARLRDYVVVCGTKPVDPSLDAYVSEGYTRIDHWPPVKKDFERQQEGQARFILWPHMKAREDLRRFKAVYAKMLEDVFVEGRWCVVVDEGLWMAGRKGLGLETEIGDVAYGSASNKVSLYLLVQRESNVGPVAWTSVSDAMVFHMGRVSDVRDIASLGTKPPNDVVKVIQHLRGHQFLELPCRGGADWSISEVDLRQR
jgi:hypothetical protein